MITPLLNGKWERIGPTTIRGRWFEDDGPYEITAPSQLIDSVIEMQSYFAEMYRRKLDIEHKLEIFNHPLFHEDKIKEENKNGN